jgi:hypothetical protein
MSQNSFVSDADAALANLIWKIIEDDSTAKKAITSRDEISFSSPKGAGAQKRKLSIFLYNINGETADSNGKIECPASFALHYLVTPFTGSDEDDHMLIGKIVQAFSATPTTANSDGTGGAGLKVKVDALSLDQLTKLWSALGAQLRLSVSLTVSPSNPRLNLQAEATGGPVAPKAQAVDYENALQFYQVVLKTFNEQSDGWKKRNMVVRQWVLQDFKKCTGMTVEEMQMALDSLGGKLEQHLSTDQFIKPLSHLKKYYQHQLDQLTGMQKVSHNQSENLQTLGAWIKDVEALVKTLTAHVPA